VRTTTTREARAAPTRMGIIWFCFLGPGRLEVRVECLEMVVVLCDEVVFEVLLVVL